MGIIDVTLIRESTKGYDSTDREHMKEEASAHHMSVDLLEL